MEEICGSKSSMAKYIIALVITINAIKSIIIISLFDAQQNSKNLKDVEFLNSCV